jgi:hypothetical protein
MKKLFVFFFLLLLSVAFGQNQKIYAKIKDSIHLQADNYLGKDQFEFYYYTKDNVLYKKKGAESFEYKNPSFGKITKVDIKNPLKIVLFYESFNIVILLDNQLNETQKLNFFENTSPIAVSAIGIALQNKLWIYNSLNQQIGLFDYIKNEYKTISIPFPENIKYYQTDFNTFYWIDNKLNWYSCDPFGKITARGKTADFNAIEIINDHQFIYSKNYKLFYVDLKKKVNQELNIAEKTFEKFYYKDQILSIFTSNRIINYKITTP